MNSSNSFHSSVGPKGSKYFGFMFKDLLLATLGAVGFLFLTRKASKEKNNMDEIKKIYEDKIE